MDILYESIFKEQNAFMEYEYDKIYKISDELDFFRSIGILNNSNYIYEERLLPKLNLYHVSPELKLKLKHKGLWLVTKDYATYGVEFAARSANQRDKLVKRPAIYRIKPKKQLNILNMLNPNDVNYTKKQIEIMDFKYAKELTERILKNNQFQTDKLDIESTEDLKALFEWAIGEFRTTEYRDFSLLAQLSGAIWLAGWDGWAEDGLAIDHIIRNSSMIFAPMILTKTAIFILDAAECLEIVEELHPKAIITDDKIKRARSVGDRYERIIKSARRFNDEI